MILVTGQICFFCEWVTIDIIKCNKNRKIANSLKELVKIIIVYPQNKSLFNTYLNITNVSFELSI